MDTRKIKDIKTLDNVRKDVGDLTELAASIKEKGILQPLLIDKAGNLIAGHRRLAAAKSVGLTEVPVAILDDKERVELQLIENIQRKELNPVEEAEAFQAYMKKSGHGVEYLAKKISKDKEFIEKRIALVNLIPEAKKMLTEKKIKLGHAIILSRLEAANQKTMLSKAKGLSVSEFEHSMTYSNNVTADLSRAIFDKTKGKDGDNAGSSGCTGCRYNGGSQILLSDLEGSGLKNKCLKPSCFNNKTGQQVILEANKLKEKGANVISEKDLAKLKYKQEMHSWDSHYKQAEKESFSKPEKYATILKFDYGRLEKKLFLIEKPKGGKAEKDSEISGSNRRSPEELLKDKMESFRHETIVKKMPSLVKNGKDFKALLLFHLFENYSMADATDAVAESLGLDADVADADKIFSLKEDKLDAALHKISENIFAGMDEETLLFTAKIFGYAYEKHFAMSEEFLEMFTKDHLIKLNDELDLPILQGLDSNKKGALVKHIMANWKPGKVPKILAGKTK